MKKKLKVAFELLEKELQAASNTDLTRLKGGQQSENTISGFWTQDGIMFNSFHQNIGVQPNSTNSSSSGEHEYSGNGFWTWGGSGWIWNGDGEPDPNAPYYGEDDSGVIITVSGSSNNSGYWWDTDSGSDSGDFWEMMSGYANENNQNLRSSQNLFGFFLQYEEFRATKYDANPPKGDWTIGIGHKIKPGENFDGVTLDITQAKALLAKDLLYWEKQVKANITIDLLQHQFDALVAFAMNVKGGLSSTSAPTLIDAVNRCSDTDEEMKRIWRLYSSPNDPGIHTGLLNRRTDEFEMFQYGDYVRNH